jgi:hypothetical protein
MFPEIMLRELLYAKTYLKLGDTTVKVKKAKYSIHPPNALGGHLADNDEIYKLFKKNNSCLLYHIIISKH